MTIGRVAPAGEGVSRWSKRFGRGKPNSVFKVREANIFIANVSFSVLYLMKEERISKCGGWNVVWKCGFVIACLC